MGGRLDEIDRDLERLRKRLDALGLGALELDISEEGVLTFQAFSAGPMTVGTLVALDKGKSVRKIKGGGMPFGVVSKVNSNGTVEVVINGRAP